ncbi:unnamed protein product [Prunus brigantina]
MSDMKRCLERQEREIKERRCRRVEEKRMQQEDDEQVAMAVGMLDLSRQGRHREFRLTARDRTLTNLDPTLTQQNIFHGCPRPSGFDGRCHKMVNKNEN